MSTMMCNVLSITLIIAGTISYCDSLRIRRSGVAGYDDPYGLTNALGVMERTQRAQYGSLLDRGFPNEDTYFNPNSRTDFELSPIDYLKAMGYDDDDVENAIAEDVYGRQLPSYSRFGGGEIPVMFDGEDTIGYGPQKRTAYYHRRVVPTLEELRTLFGEADVPMKRLAPVKRRQPDVSNLRSMDIPATDRTESEKEDLTKQWGDLINAAQQLNGNGVNVEGGKKDEEGVNSDLDNADKTLQDNLEEVFSDAQVDDNDYGQMKDNSEINDENIQPQSKSKRASSGLGKTSDYVLALLKDISELKEKVSMLEMKQELEDRENDFLADALKYSTLDQMTGDSEYVKNEYSDIAKATKIEELIQDFSDAVEEQEEQKEADEIDDEILDNDLAEEDGEVMKRSDDDVEDPEGQWLEAPVKESVTGGAYIKDDIDDDASLEPTSLDSYVDNVDNDDTEDDAMERAVEEAFTEEEEEAPRKDDKEVVLARLISKLSPATVQEILADLQNADVAPGADKVGVCPAVAELSENCAFADQLGVPLDDEARNLCVRHQLCYTCGKAIGISAKECDAGYKGEVIDDCGDDVKCVRSAAYFLQLMTSRFHIYESFNPELCLEPCLSDFIYGVK